MISHTSLCAVVFTDFPGEDSCVKRLMCWGSTIFGGEKRLRVHQKAADEWLEN